VLNGSLASLAHGASFVGSVSGLLCWTARSLRSLTSATSCRMN